MKCRGCDKENPEGAAYCIKCGARLTLVCPQCGTELPLDPDLRFCLKCGQEIGQPVEAGIAALDALGPKAVEGIAERLQRLVPKEFTDQLLATRGKLEAERRMVTMLFSDVKGSTAMAEELDPESWMEIMDGAVDVLIEPIYRYEGTLARLMGDAVNLAARMSYTSSSTSARGLTSLVSRNQAELRTWLCTKENYTARQR